MCSDDDDTSTQVSNPTEIASTLADGQWIVTLYKENDVVKTNNYSGYNFTFGTDSALSATNGTTTQSGDWSTYADSGYTKLDMMFTALDGPFEEISEIIEDPLPWSAIFRSNKFWLNSEKNHYYYIWKDAGFKAQVYPRNLTVHFTKNVLKTMK